MEPGHFAVVSWIPKQTDTNGFHDTLTIYDAGNIQGFLLKETTGKTTWIVFQVDYRLVQEDGVILEGRTILPDTSAPLRFHSRETYPMLFQSQGRFQKLLTLPQVQILLSLSEDPLFSPPPSEPLPLVPSHLTNQRQAPRFHESRVKHDVPVSRESPKLDSLRQVGAPQSSQNKSKASPRSKASPFSNPKSRAQPLSQAPVTQAVHPQPSFQEHHTGHESSESHPWLSLAQQSLYSRPPPDLVGVLVEQVSASLPPKDSELN